MENEVSGIAKLGIVLIALAVLIGLGFGIFQISKGTANTGVNNVQAELDGVAVSQYSTYDQTVVTGTIARSALSQYEGKEAAILVATQAWINYVDDSESGNDAQGADANATNTDLMSKGSGFNIYKDENAVPVVWAYSKEDLNNGTYKTLVKSGETANSYTMKTTANTDSFGSFINYNALLGSNDAGTTGVTGALYNNGTAYHMAGIYFDKNCFRCTTGFMTSANGRVQYNNIVGNIQKTGTTEFIPTGAKFQSYLVKDPSGTVMGIALQQINNV